MSNRHLIRSIVLQSLFEWDFKEKKDSVDDFINYNIEEFAPTLEKEDFLQFLIKGVTRNIKVIDKVIKTYAPEWPINQIAVIDRNILRIAIFELIYNDATPYKVIINEAVELSKNFGSNNSSKFVNGVLGTVFEKLNENITNIYEIGLIIKEKDKYLVNKNDDKLNFVRFNNEIKEKEEILKIEELKKNAEKEKESTEKNIDESLKNAEKVEEKIIESNDERLDNNDFITNNSEKEENELLAIEQEKKENEKKYINFSKEKINELLGKISYDIKNLGEVNYCIRKDGEGLFPLITKKNIIFLLINNINEVKNIKIKGEWVDENEILDNIEYKNLKKILKNL